jgi:aminopeptidase-like protein
VEIEKMYKKNSTQSSREVSELPFEDLLGFIERNYMKNRSIVTEDISGILDDVEKVTGLSVFRHKYATGEDHSTWIIPPQWDVVQAWLKDKDGKVIASYEDHPLFLCPYSKSIHVKLSKEELMSHTTWEPRQPDAYAYNWRYAMDNRLRLKDWGVSLPQDIVQGLDDDGLYEILIDVKVKDGEMLVGEICLPGETDDTFIFLSDFCHPGQVNDSFSGLAMFMKVMHSIAQLPKRKYTYKMLILPETIGSAAYITSELESLKKVKGAMFAEMVGWGEAWYMKETRSSNTYMNLLAKECCRKFPELKLSEFFSLIGNDEYMFDSVQANIPSLSLQKYPYDQYHTSNDEPSHIEISDFQKAYDITMHMVNSIERDKTCEFVHPVPFWMTRFDLYADYHYESEDYQKRFNVVYKLLDGKCSNLKIADLLNCELEEITFLIDAMAKNKLVRELPMNFSMES